MDMRQKVATAHGIIALKTGAQLRLKRDLVLDCLLGLRFMVGQSPTQ